MDPSIYILENKKPKFEIYNYDDDDLEEEKIVELKINKYVPEYIKIQNLPEQEVLYANLDYVYNLSLKIGFLENYMVRTIIDTIDDSMFNFLKKRSLNLKLLSDKYTGDNKIKISKLENTKECIRQIMDISKADLFHCTRNYIDLALETLNDLGTLIVKFENEPDFLSLGFYLSFVFNSVSFLRPLTSDSIYLVCQGYDPTNKNTVFTYIKKKYKKSTKKYNEYVRKSFSKFEIKNYMKSDLCRLLTEWDVENSVL